MRRNLPILEPPTDKMTKCLAEPLILAFSPIGEKGPPLPRRERVGVKVLAIAAAIALITPPTATARDVIHKGDVVGVPLQGKISPSLLMFLRRGLKAAETSGASAIIFEMNTYGGRLDTAEEITSTLNHATIPTYTFINSNAGSDRNSG